MNSADLQIKISY